MTSSAEGSPASPSVSPEPDKPKTTPDGCGPSSSESFAAYDPDSSSWKTSQGSLLPEWATYSETWPRSGMTRNGRAFRQRLLALRISGGGSSLLHTPTATGNQAAPSMRSRDPGSWFPTPTAVSYGSNQGGGMGRVGPVRYSLESMARRGMWPTPTQADGMGGPGSSGRDGGDNLRTAVNGQLNPTWVSQLMGFPLGWEEPEQD